MTDDPRTPTLGALREWLQRPPTACPAEARRQVLSALPHRPPRSRPARFDWCGATAALAATAAAVVVTGLCWPRRLPPDLPPPDDSSPSVVVVGLESGTTLYVPLTHNSDPSRETP